MHFPRFRDDHPYVLIVRGDGFPCGARSWCQIACGFANHMQKARTLLCNWTLDLALVSEHETDLVRVLFGETLKKIQQILDRGYMLLRGFWVRTVVIIGGNSPWLRHILGLSTFYEIGSIYSFATWSREKERWVGCEWRQSTRLEAKFLKYRKQGVSCVGAKGCIESPLLKVDDRIGCVIMCHDALDEEAPPRRQGWGPVLPLGDEVPERRGVFGVEVLCVSVFWDRCVGLLLSCCLLVDCAGVFWSFGRCFDMTHAVFRCCVFFCL